MTIQYVDRATQQINQEKIYGHTALSLFYGDSYIAKVFSLFFLPLFARNPLFSRFYGFLQKTSGSAKKVDPFITSYGIDKTEFVETSFGSFNDFFIRKLKPEKRPILSDPACVVMPADGRYLVFPSISFSQGFYVKGQSFDLAEFLQDHVYAHRYAEGSMAIVRLCPVDYHRFHFVADGTPSVARPIRGNLYSVNPIALRKNLSILWNNKRIVTEIETEKFGTILCVEIGATCVGTIHQTYAPGKKVNKGEEKGYFSFGGSCIVLLFEKGSIVFDDDLIVNSQKGLETKANFGESLARIPSR